MVKLTRVSTKNEAVWVNPTHVTCFYGCTIKTDGRPDIEATSIITSDMGSDDSPIRVIESPEIVAAMFRAK